MTVLRLSTVGDLITTSLQDLAPRLFTGQKIVLKSRQIKTPNGACRTSSREQRQIDRVGQDSVAAGRRVQVIAAVHGFAEARRPGGIARDRIEVDDAVELAAG